MTTQKSKGNILPPLQKRIILYLAKNGAQTRNETKNGLKGHYKSTLFSFNALEQKGLIKKTDLKIYNNRKFPRFWLTQAGIFVALLEGADATNLLQRTIKKYPNDKTLQFCLELSPLLSLEAFRIALSTIQHKGKLDHSDITSIFLTHYHKDVSVQQLKALIKISRKYPKEIDRIKKQIDLINKFLTKPEFFI